MGSLADQVAKLLEWKPPPCDDILHEDSDINMMSGEGLNMLVVFLFYLLTLFFSFLLVVSGIDSSLLLFAFLFFFVPLLSLALSSE